MGQRHQCFLIVKNPINTLSKPKKMVKELGNEDITVLAFHNQWLFGGTALASALNILEHVSEFTVDEKVNVNSYTAGKSPFCLSALKNEFNYKTYIETITFILNYQQKETSFRKAGMLGSFFLNATEKYMREDFTCGDNNDGITIIDTINNKYCFMNIHDYSNVEDKSPNYSASDLPYLTPASARDYIKAYYGETLETCKSYYLEKKENPNDVIDGHIENNSTLSERFNSFELLTIDELIGYFPKLKDELTTAKEKILVV
jgi:hypothetical protein